MGQWMHKDAGWHGVIWNDDTMMAIMLVEGVPKSERWNYLQAQLENGMDQHQFQAKALSFTQWLDYHCQDGWEVFKISRDFNSRGNNTWCVFRRLV